MMCGPSDRRLNRKVFYYNNGDLLRWEKVANRVCRQVDGQMHATESSIRSKLNPLAKRDHILLIYNRTKVKMW